MHPDTTTTTVLVCDECGDPIRDCGGGSYVHLQRIRGRNHPAQLRRETEEVES